MYHLYAYHSLQVPYLGVVPCSIALDMIRKIIAFFIIVIILNITIVKKFECSFPNRTISSKRPMQHATEDKSRRLFRSLRF